MNTKGSNTVKHLPVTILVSAFLIACAGRVRAEEGGGGAPRNQPLDRDGRGLLAVHGERQSLGTDRHVTGVPHVDGNANVAVGADDGAAQ